jgi:hypothetical protein
VNRTSLCFLAHSGDYRVVMLCSISELGPGDMRIGGGAHVGTLIGGVVQRACCVDYAWAHRGYAYCKRHVHVCRRVARNSRGRRAPAAKQKARNATLFFLKNYATNISWARHNHLSSFAERASLSELCLTWPCCILEPG